MATEIKLECPMGHKKTMRCEEADGEQPICEQCFMPLIVQEVVTNDIHSLAEDQP